jgi:hypothetical protein
VLVRTDLGVLGRNKNKINKFKNIMQYKAAKSQTKVKANIPAEYMRGISKVLI